MARVMEHYAFPADVPITFKNLLMDSLGLANPALIPGWGGKYRSSEPLSRA